MLYCTKNYNTMFWQKRSSYSHDSFVSHKSSSNISVQFSDYCTVLSLNQLCIQYSSWCYSSYTCVNTQWFCWQITMHFLSKTYSISFCQKLLLIHMEVFPGSTVVLGLYGLQQTVCSFHWAHGANWSHASCIWVNMGQWFWQKVISIFCAKLCSIISVKKIIYYYMLYCNVSYDLQV